MDYPTCLIYKEFDVLNIKQTYIYTLLKYYHKYNIYYDHGYRTRRNTKTHPIFEPKCNTEAGLRHSSGFGTRLYNNFVNKHPNLISMNIKLFKKHALKLITNMTNNNNN